MRVGKIKPLGKIVIAMFIAGVIFAGVKFADSRGWLEAVMPSGSSSFKKPSMPEGVDKDTPVINVGVVTWGGYAGGQYFNNGFLASTESRYYTEYGVLVNFIVIDDFAVSRDAWKSGKIDLLWATADSFNTEAESLAKYNPKIVMQADWSRGGDALVVTRSINKMNDIKGKKVAVALGTPSHTFLIMLLKSAGIDYNEIDVVEMASAVDAATAFKAGSVDAAVVWSPDDDDCIKTIPGSKVLQSTKEARHIIADVFFAKEEWIADNKKSLKAFVEGFLVGAAEINNNESAKRKAAVILSEGLNQPVDFCVNAINNVRLATYGDNINFFNINGDYSGVKGEEIYTDMAREYMSIGYIKDRPPTWREVSDPSVIRSIHLEGDKHMAEADIQFSAPGSKYETAEAISVKALTVNYDTGSSVLSDTEKAKIQKEYGRIARQFTGNRIRIEGNTDITGNREQNIRLSKARANAVAKFLIETYGFDQNRFIIIGNGPDKPVCNEDTESCYSRNRRTDFSMIGN